MPLTKTLIEVPLTSGLSEKSDLRSNAPAEAVIMSNCVRLKTGAVTKRFGHTAITKTGLPSAKAVSAGSYHGQAWLWGGDRVSTYSDQAGVWNPGNRGSRSGILDRTALSATNAQLVDYDIGYGGGYLIYVFQDNLTTGVNGTKLLFWGAIDMSGGANPNSQGPSTSVTVPMTGVIAAPPGSLVAPKLIICGTTAVCCWQEGGATPIRVAKLDLTNLGAGWSVPATLVAPGGTAQLGVYDISAIKGDASRFCAICEVAAGSGTVALNIFSVASLASSTLRFFDVNANFNTCKSMTLCAVSLGHYWLSYVATAGAGIAAGAPAIRAAFWNETGNVSAAPITAATRAAGEPIGKMGADSVEPGTLGTGAVVAYSPGYAAGITAMIASTLTCFNLIDTAGVISVAFGGVGGNLFASTLSSRPWIMPDRSVFLGLLTPSLVQGTDFLVRSNAVDVFGFAEYSLEGVFAPRLAKSQLQPMAAGGTFTLPHIVQIASQTGSVFSMPIGVSTSAFHQALVAEMWEDAAPRAYQAADCGSLQAMTAACPALYDGVFLSEPSFIAYPEVDVADAGGGGNLSAGTYQYIVYFETRDINGNVHRSATSVAQSVALLVSHMGLVEASSLPITNRKAYGVITDTDPNATSLPVFWAIYRTTANGTLFYRVTPDPPTAAFQLGPSALVYTDNLSDADLTNPATAQLLYTTGGVLDSFIPPGARAVAQYANRWILAGCDEPTQVWPSKALTTGEAPAFNEAMSFNATGAVRALASMDDKLILFVQRGSSYGIEYISGQGPTDEGTNNDWQPPLQIMSDSGAIDQRGVCTGPFGVLYRSPVGGPSGTGGIFLLTRDLQVQYVSGPVENAIQGLPLVTSMTVHPNAGRVYINLTEDDYNPENTGERVVWDYLFGGLWSADLLGDPDTSTTTASVRCAFVAMVANSGFTYGLTYHWVTPLGRVYREVVTNDGAALAHTDAGMWIPMTYTTSWLKPSLAGFARFWRVQLQSDWLDNADLTMTLTFDTDTFGYQETVTWTAAQIQAFNRFPQVDTQMTVGNQKARSIQVTLSDAPPTGGPVMVSGQGFSWAVISLELGVKEGRYQNIPPGQRA